MKYAAIHKRTKKLYTAETLADLVEQFCVFGDRGIVEMEGCKPFVMHTFNHQFTPEEIRRYRADHISNMGSPWFIYVRF